MTKRLSFVAAVIVMVMPAEIHAIERIVVGSKNFSENRLLAEIFAQLIEARTDLEVVRKLSLAGTQVCFEALRSGEIDVYPEYTGTGLVTILKENPELGARETLNRVRREFLSRWNLVWLAPLGFENAFELAVRRDVAEAHGLRKISDLRVVAPSLVIGSGYEFGERKDGLPGLQARYGLEFKAIRLMQQGLKYEAAGAGDIQCLDVYTTDGRLVRHDLVVLEDDLAFFPPYEAAALVSGATLERHPEVGAALAQLAGGLDEETMRRLNYRLEVAGEDTALVAAEILAELLPVSRSGGREPGAVEGASLGAYMWSRRDTLLRQLVEHLQLSGLGLGLGVLLALPLGLWLESRRRFAESTIRAISITQTIPSLALLAFMIPLFGIGFTPAVVALWVYSLYPIVRNTYSGVRDASPPAVEAARALGMTQAQVLLQVRLPLAAPVIMAGIRTAAVLVVGTATLSTYIGAGGLGDSINIGLQMNQPTVVLAGAIPTALLAILVDALLGFVERAVRPRGLAAE